MKKVISVLLVLVLVLTNGIAVLAEEVSTPPANQISADPNYAHAIYIAPVTTEKEANLRFGEDGLTIELAESSLNKSGCTLNVYARTDSNITSAEIGGTVYIQRWKNNKWNNYYMFSFFAYGTATCSTNNSISVESGYYYRVYVSHEAITPSTVRTIGTSTQCVYV